MRLALLAASFATFAYTAHAAEPQPEIQRAVGAPPAVGALHTLRVIPEACARIQGKFTGNSAKPYDFAVVQTGTRCQPRAKLVDAAKVKPQGKPGWIYADLVRVPSAALAELLRDPLGNHVVMIKGHVKRLFGEAFGLV